MASSSTSRIADQPAVNCRRCAPARSLPYMPPVIVCRQARTAAVGDMPAISPTGSAQRSCGMRHPLERLLEETVSCCTGRRPTLSDDQRAVLARLHEPIPARRHKRVLVVDDDLRNIFALTSVLEHHNINVLHAENGRSGIEMLQKHPSRHRADGHHDARDGWLRDHAGDPQDPAIPLAADHRADRKSDEGRPREMPRSGRLGLHHEAGRTRAAVLRAARLGVADLQETARQTARLIGLVPTSSNGLSEWPSDPSEDDRNTIGLAIRCC